MDLASMMNPFDMGLLAMSAGKDPAKFGPILDQMGMPLPGSPEFANMMGGGGQSLGALLGGGAGPDQLAGSGATDALGNPIPGAEAPALPQMATPQPAMPAAPAAPPDLAGRAVTAPMMGNQAPAGVDRQMSPPLPGAAPVPGATAVMDTNAMMGGGGPNQPPFPVGGQQQQQSGKNPFSALAGVKPPTAPSPVFSGGVSGTKAPEPQKIGNSQATALLMQMLLGGKSGAAVPSLGALLK